jgi:hypothetical protein
MSENRNRDNEKSRKSDKNPTTLTLGQRRALNRKIARAISEAACDALEPQAADYWHLSRLDLSSLFSGGTAVLVYEAMRDARREQIRAYVPSRATKARAQ